MLLNEGERDQPYMALLTSCLDLYMASPAGCLERRFTGAKMGVLSTNKLLLRGSGELRKANFRLPT